MFFILLSVSTNIGLHLHFIYIYSIQALGWISETKIKNLSSLPMSFQHYQEKG